MKQRIFPVLLAALLFMTLLSGRSAIRSTAQDSIQQGSKQSVSQSVTTATEGKLYNTPTPDQITEGEAMSIALTHAGISAEKAQFLYTEYEIDDRVPQYDVQFYADGIEYEYEIHAETGKILSFDRDR